MSTDDLQVSEKQEAAIRKIFEAFVADCQSNGGGNADGCLPFSELFDLSCALNDPLSPVELDQLSEIFGDQIEWTAFIEYWKNCDSTE